MSDSAPELRKQSRGYTGAPVIPFAQPDSLTRVCCFRKGKSVNGCRDGRPRPVDRGCWTLISTATLSPMISTTDRPTQALSR